MALQVPRILNPVVLVLEALPKLCKDGRIDHLVRSSWGDIDQCRSAPRMCCHTPSSTSPAAEELAAAESSALTSSV